MFDLSYYAHIQPSEVLEMEVSDIDWNYGQLYERKKRELQTLANSVEGKNV
jgi:integrase